jgi:putative ABC transport system permease protein
MERGEQLSWEKLMDSVMKDIRFAVRRFAQNPGFTIIIILTLGLGIGANTAIFSVVDAVLLRPLPYKESDRLVVAWDKGQNRGRSWYSAASLLQQREQNRVFEILAGWAQAGFNLSDRGLPERVDGMLVSWDFFKALGVTTNLGRTFNADEDRGGAPRVAIISNELWHRKFNGDSSVVGRSVTVDGQACTIIGVMPPLFRFFYGPEMWMPLALDRAGGNTNSGYLRTVGRLKPGMSLAQASAQWDGLVEPLQAVSRLGLPKGLLELFGASAFLLLITCVNVANLLLARSTGRRRELAVRAAMGASRGRLLRQLLTESVLLALAGGFLGSLLAVQLVTFLPAMLPAELLSNSKEISVDDRVLAFTFALSIVTGLFFGVLPAWRASRPDLQDDLKEGGWGSSGAASHARFRNILVIAEVALSLVLLSSAGLMLRSLLALKQVDLGFHPDHVVTMRLSITKGGYSSPTLIREYYQRALDAARTVPGVRDAGISMGQAPWDSPIAGAFDLPGNPPASVSEFRGAVYETVSPAYFRTVGINLLKGRFFTERDNESAPPVAIVNQTFVRLYLPAKNPLGQRVMVGKVAGNDPKSPPTAYEIVGIVEDIKFGGPTANNAQIIYMPIRQNPPAEGALVLRTSANPLRVAQSVRVALGQIDRETPVTQIKTMDQIVLDTMLQPRTQTWLLLGFAAIALLLAALGNYGVSSYYVAQNTHDIGIRMALGAAPGEVLKLVLRKGMLLTGIGVLAGLAGAFVLTRFLSSLLFGVKATDPLTFAAVSLLLACVSALAIFFPARRATRVDPLVALRYE